MLGRIEWHCIFSGPARQINSSPVGLLKLDIFFSESVHCILCRLTCHSMTKYSCIYLYTGTQTSLHEITSSTHATNQTTFFLTNISTRSCRIYDVGLWKQPNTNTHTYWKHDLLVCKTWQTQEVRWGSSNNTLQCRGIKLVMMAPFAGLKLG